MFQSRLTRKKWFFAKIFWEFFKNFSKTRKKKAIFFFRNFLEYPVLRIFWEFLKNKQKILSKIIAKKMLVHFFFRNFQKNERKKKHFWTIKKTNFWEILTKFQEFHAKNRYHFFVIFFQEIFQQFPKKHGTHQKRQKQKGKQEKVIFRRNFLQ